MHFIIQLEYEINPKLFFTFEKKSKSDQLQILRVVWGGSQQFFSSSSHQYWGQYTKLKSQVVLIAFI